MQALMQTRKGTALAIAAWVADAVALIAVWNFNGILVLLPIVFFMVFILGGVALPLSIVFSVATYKDYSNTRYSTYEPPFYLPILIDQVELNTLDRMNRRREGLIKAIEECKRQAKIHDELDPRHITLTAQADHLTRLSGLIFEDIEQVSQEIGEARRERRYKQLMKGE